MNARILIAMAVFSMALLGCKKSEPENQTTLEQTPIVENFQIELSVKAEKDDNFSAYFTEDGTIDFSGENAVWSGVSASETMQPVVFNLPETVMPTHLRLDFGINKDQGDVVLSKVTLRYMEKEFSFNGSDFFKYFIETDIAQTQVDSSAGTITFLKGNTERSTPFYYPHQLLLDEIQKLQN